jgi:nickel-dependent lactate racemase
MSLRTGALLRMQCQSCSHSSNRRLANVGQTRFGTPVQVNAEIVQSDFVLGIGSLYPNRAAGFGGRSKLVLGTLGSRSIAHLTCAS